MKNEKRDMNVKILLISLSDIKYDGRLRELYKICNSLGKVYPLITDYENNYKNKKIKGRLLIKYQKMLNMAIDIIRKEKIDIVFLDNRKSFALGLILRVLFKNIIFITDCRELYVKTLQMSNMSKIGCDIERLMVSRADIVICANEFRANKMVEIFGLKNRPLIYQNIRELEYKEETDFDELEKKYKNIFDDGVPVIISTAGVDIERTTDKLVRAFKQIDDCTKLLLVGGGTENDITYIKKIVKEQDIKNVYIVGRVKEDELKFLISKSMIGVVIYSQDTLNNIFCASGKVFEFVFEGVPIIASSNPPLLELCKNKNIGIASDDYACAIKCVLNSYSYFKNAVEDMQHEIDIIENNDGLLWSLKDRIEGVMH